MGRLVRGVRLGGAVQVTAGVGMGGMIIVGCFGDVRLSLGLAIVRWVKGVGEWCGVVSGQKAKGEEKGGGLKMYMILE